MQFHKEFGERGDYKVPICQTLTPTNSYAEMDKDAKNLISHRFKALEKLKTWLLNEKTEEKS